MEVNMNNTEKKFFDEEQVKDYLMGRYIEALNAACESAATEPQITRISVLWLGDYCIEVGVWLENYSEEAGCMIGSRLFSIKGHGGRIFTVECYPSDYDRTVGLVVYTRDNKEA